MTVHQGVRVRRRVCCKSLLWCVTSLLYACRMERVWCRARTLLSLLMSEMVKRHTGCLAVASSVHIHTYIPTDKRTYTQTHIHTNTHTRTQTHTHTHIHTHCVSPAQEVDIATNGCRSWNHWNTFMSHRTTLFEQRPEFYSFPCKSFSKFLLSLT